MSKSELQMNKKKTFDELINTLILIIVGILSFIQASLQYKC